MTVAMETVAEATEVAVSPATASALDPRWLGTSKAPGILLRSPPEVDAPGSAPVGDVTDLDLARSCRSTSGSICWQAVARRSTVR